MLNNIVEYTQYFVKALGVLVALLGLKLVWVLGKAMAKWPWLEIADLLFVQFPIWAWHKLLAVWHLKLVILETCGEILLVSAAVVIITLSFIKLWQKCDLDVELDPYFMAFLRFLDKCISGLAAPFIGFATFVWEYVKLFKQNHCPQINWVD
jgi:hypothetical protein